MKETDKNKPKTTDPTKVKHAALAAAVGTGVATGTGLGIASHIAMEKPLDPSLYQQFLVRDKPINEIPIIGMHNAGTEPGSGTEAFASNQSMSITDALNNTPVRALAIDVWDDNGQFVINHGGIYDPTQGSPTTFTDTLNEINNWATANPNQPLFIDMEYGFAEYGSPKTEADWDKVAQVDAQLKAEFGDRIWTATDQQQFFSQNGRWPTVDELTASGHQIILSDAWGDNVMFASNPAALQAEGITSIGEDRNMYAPFIRDGLYPDMPNPISTKDVDSIVSSNQGGIIWLDKISPNDPRFLLPEDRDKLLLRPDTTVGSDIFYTNTGIANEITFATGTGLAATTGSMAIASTLFQAYQNKEYLRSVDNGKLLKKMIPAIDYSDLHKKYGNDVTEGQIKEHTRKQVKNNVTRRSFFSGASGTVGLSAAILSMGLLFAPAFPAFAIAALSVFGAGTALTTINTVIQRRRADKAVEQGLKVNQDLVKAKTAELNTQKDGKGAKDINALPKNPRQFDKSLENIAKTLIGVTLFTRISGMAKYMMPAIGTAAAGVGSGSLMLSSAVGGITNYRARKNQYKKDTASGVHNAIMSSIDRKPHLGGLFGKTDFDKYVEKNAATIKDELVIKGNVKPKDIIKELDQESNLQLLNKHRQVALKEHFNEAFKQYSSKNPKLRIKISSKIRYRMKFNLM